MGHSDGIPWLRSDCRIGRPEDALSRACWLPRGSDFADSSLSCGTHGSSKAFSRRDAESSDQSSSVSRYLGNKRARGMRAYSEEWEVRHVGR